MTTTVVCPGCEQPLRVPLDESGYAYCVCRCGETIEVENGIVIDRWTWAAAEAAGLQRGLFSVGKQVVFEGWHHPEERREAWALPLFSKAEADRLAAHISGTWDGYNLEYDVGGDRYVYRAPHVEPAYFHPIWCGGARFYAIGHDSWSWRQVR